MNTPELPQAVRWAARLDWEDVAGPAREATLRTIANVVGLGVAGMRSPAVELLLAAMDEVATPGPQIPLLGRVGTASLADSCLLHGTAMHVEDFDDTHLGSVLHPGAPIVPVALALGHQLGVSGDRVAAAVCSGVEVACRAGLSMGREHFDRGWHVTSTVGRLGGALAAANLLRFEDAQLRALLAWTTATFAGHTEQLGTMTKPLHAGKAAADVVSAALKIADGWLSGAGPSSLAVGREMAGALHWAEIDEGLGERWEILENAFKPYACGIVSHPIIDAGRRCRDEGVRGDDIESVEIMVHPTVPAVMGVRSPASGLEAKFSAYHCFAIGVLRGAGGLDEFSDVVARDAAVRRLRDRVTLKVHDDMPKDSCVARLALRDGQRTVEVAHATGSSARPMSNEDLGRKFATLTEGLLADTRAAWRSVIRLDQAPDLVEVWRCTSGAMTRA